MKELKVVINQEPIIKEYKVFDDYLEAHKEIAQSDNFEFQYEQFTMWDKISLNGNIYFYNLNNSNLLLTPEARRRLFEDAKRVFSIRERDLVRTQRNSNTRFTGHLDSISEVIEYMRDEQRSWLPQVFKEIDEDISELQKKIDELNHKKETLKDDGYLAKNVRVNIIVKSKKEVL
jgi:hypothetical protein